MTARAVQEVVVRSTPGPGESFCCSWSGGKDSCLALQRALRAGAKPRALLTLLTEDGARSRSHGLRREVLEAQAAALRIPLRAAPASWSGYRGSFIALLEQAARAGLASVVFGDIDIEAHGRWEVEAAAAAGLSAHLPLWQTPRHSLLEEWWAASGDARVVVVRDGLLAPGHLGRRLDRHLVRELEARGLDACGENGEFHTVAVDGAAFFSALSLRPGARVRRGDCWCLDLRADTPRGTGG